MAKRWVCPRCSKGAIAPERPRKDDVRRYCLPCSKKTGKLVERTCPALDKRREAKAALTRQRKKKAADKRAADPREHIRRLFNHWKRHPVWAGDCAHATVTVHAHKSKERTSGYAYYMSGEVHLTIGSDPAMARAVILHELAHVAQGRRDPLNTRGHDDGFRSILMEAATEIVGPVDPPTQDHIHDLDVAVAEAIRRLYLGGE